MSYILIGIIYLSGIAPTYFLARKDWSEGGQWEIGERNLAIIFSLFSWIMFFSGLMGMLLRRVLMDDRPAKW